VDGIAWQILVEATQTGAPQTAADVQKLADALRASEQAVTPFDASLKLAQASLATASASTASAASALSAAESRFTGLERAAVKAGKALDSVRGAGENLAIGKQARVSGADLASLERAAAKEREYTAAAQAAQAAVAAMVPTLDAARAAHTANAAAESQEAARLDSLKRAAQQAGSVVARSSAQGSAGFKQIGTSASSALAAVSPFAGRIGAITSQLAGLGVAGLAVAAVIGAIAIAVGVANAAWSVFKFALLSNEKVAKRFDEAFKKARKSTAELFAKVNTAQVATALEGVLHLLDANTSTGRALQKLMSIVFNPVMSAAAALAPLLKELFIGAVVAALQFATKCYMVRNAVLRAIPPELRANIRAAIASIDAAGVAFSAGKYIFTLIAVSVGIAAVAFAAFAAALMVPVVAVAALVAGIVWLAGAIGSVLGFVSAAEVALAGMDGAAIQAGMNFVAGLASSIESGAGAVAQAAKDLALSAVNAVKSALGIASKSKVMTVQGKWTAAGLAGGMEQGTPGVAVAAKHMAGAAVSATRSPMQQAGDSSVINSKSTSQSTGGNTYHITIQAPGGTAGDIENVVRELFIRIVDGAAIELGGGEVPA